MAADKAILMLLGNLVDATIRAQGTDQVARVQRQFYF